MRHPLERLGADTRRVLFGCSLYVVAVGMWGFWWLGPRGTSGTVGDLALARTLTVVTGIVGGWSRNQLTIGRVAVGLDFLFILAYTTVLSLACLWLAGHDSWRPIRRAGAWLATAAGLADVVENACLLHFMSRPSGSGWMRPLIFADRAKWGLVGVSGAIGAVTVFAVISDWVTGARARRGDNVEADEAASSSSSLQMVRVTRSAAEDPSPLKLLLTWLRAKHVEPVLPARTLAEPVEGRSGMSFSGGGIRSAAINLGVIQEMDLAGELDKIDFLTAVSGGSYIASAHAILRSSDPVGDARPWSNGTPEEEYLRNRTTYLAPGSMGKLDALWRLIRGLVTNITVIASVICVAGFLFGLTVAGPHLLRPVTSCPPGEYCSFVGPTWVWWVLGVTVFLALASGAIELLHRFERDSVTRSLQAWSMRLLILFVAEAMFLLLAPALLTLVQNQKNMWTGIGSLTLGWAGALGSLAGVAGLSSLGFLTRSGSKKSGTAADGSQEQGPVSRVLKAVWQRVKGFVVKLLVAVLGPALAFMVFLSFAFAGAFRAAAFRPQAVFLAAVTGVIAVQLFGDLTSWSLHPFYKRRLSSVFALERRELPDGTLVAVEVPYDKAIEFTDLTPSKPELIVCAAVNVSDYGATPTSRHAMPFNFSREQLYAGRILGAMPMGEYQQANSTRDRDISVPAAVAMSGAALSPSMGKMSRWYATFLLAVANVRLGVWLPNPRAIEREKEGGRRVRRKAAPHYLLWELLGRNSYRHDYVYVTDGGHYENLGLVELLRRGCTEIYCFDASGDHLDTFNTFGEAVAIARSELGVEISIDPFQMKPGEDDDNYVPVDHVIGQLWFTGDREKKEPSGRVILAKAGVTRTAPTDVRSWKERDKPFPTHGTASQLYTEERFEAYRALGAHIARASIEAMHAIEPAQDSEVSRLVVVAELQAEGARRR